MFFDINYRRINELRDVLYVRGCFPHSQKLCWFQTRSPSKAASMFSGTQDKCATCGKTAYPLEKVESF